MSNVFREKKDLVQSITTAQFVDVTLFLGIKCSRFQVEAAKL